MSGDELMSVGHSGLLLSFFSFRSIHSFLHKLTYIRDKLSAFNIIIFITIFTITSQTTSLLNRVNKLLHIYLYFTVETAARK